MKRIQTVMVLTLRYGWAVGLAALVFLAMPRAAEGQVGPNDILLTPNPAAQGHHSCLFATRQELSPCDFVNEEEIHNGGLGYENGWASWQQTNSRISSCRSACQRCCDDLDTEDIARFFDTFCPCLVGAVGGAAGGIPSGGVTIEAAALGCLGALSNVLAETFGYWVIELSYKGGSAAPSYFLAPEGILRGLLTPAGTGEWAASLLGGACDAHRDGNIAAYITDCKDDCAQTYRFSEPPPGPDCDPTTDGSGGGSQKLQSQTPDYPVTHGGPIWVTAQMPPGLPPVPSHPNLPNFGPAGPAGLPPGSVPEVPDCFGPCCPSTGGGGGGGGSGNQPNDGCLLDGMPIACSSITGLLLY